MENSWIKYKRSPKARELLKNPKAHALLSCIAQRARRTSDFNVDGLEIGESMLGDHENNGLTRTS